LAGRIVAMISVNSAPTVARKKIRDWIRPFKVGSIAIVS
jgi:hypothetical protein